MTQCAHKGFSALGETENGPLFFLTSQSVREFLAGPGNLPGAEVYTTLLPPRVGALHLDAGTEPGRCTPQSCVFVLAERLA